MPAQHQPVRGDACPDWQRNAAGTAVVQRADGFKSGRSRRLQVVDKKLQLKGAGVGRPQPDAPREVCSDPGSKGDDAHLRDVNWAGELDEVEVELGLSSDPSIVVGEGVKEEELQHAPAAPSSTGPPTASPSMAPSDPHICLTGKPNLKSGVV